MVAVVPYVSIDILAAVADAAEASGLDVHSLLQQCGIVPSWLRDPERLFVPLEHEQALWTVLCAHDPGFGVQAAQALSRGAFDALEHAITASATTGEGLRRVARFGRLLVGTDAFALGLEGEGAVLTYHPLHPPERPWAHAATEFMLACVTVLLRRAANIHLRPAWVAFRHQEPDHNGASLALFGCEILYGQPRDELAFDAATLAVEMPQANPLLLRTLERAMIYELHALPNRAATTAAVRRILLEQLLDGPPDLEAVATRLEIHPRTLQARLRDEATTFQTLLDDVRREAAERYLRDVRVSMNEIAALLGYSETSAFHRAFKRWTGVAPGEYRRRHQPRL